MDYMEDLLSDPASSWFLGIRTIWKIYSPTLHPLLIPRNKDYMEDLLSYPASSPDS